MNELKTLTVFGNKYDSFESQDDGANGTGGAMEYNRVSVRDHGATGDGTTDDRGAIIAAFEKAKTMLPCEVYFPAGTYAINNGMYIKLPLGSGGLSVRGAGKDITTIRYKDFNPTYSGNNWYALRFEPESTPANEDEWLHDISITGLAVYDPNPDAHASHTAKGTATKASLAEETHGFDFQYVKRLSVTDCSIMYVGDECVDIGHCHDVIVANNHLHGCPAAGPGGGAIAVCDGSKRVTVTGNTIYKTGDDYVLPEAITLPAGVEMSGAVELPDGTVIGRYTKLTAETTLPVGTKILKNNYGVVVESLFEDVTDVTVVGNTIDSVHGWGVKIYAVQNEGTTNIIENVIVSGNIISNCDNAFNISGARPKRNLKIDGNIVSDCGETGIDASAIEDIFVSGNIFRNIGGDAVRAKDNNGNSRQFYSDNVFENVGKQAMYVAGDVIVKDCLFNGIGTAEAASDRAGIEKVSGTLAVSGCSLKDVRMAGVKYAINGADHIRYTDIEAINKSTGVADGGGIAIYGASTQSVIGGAIFGRIDINHDNAIVRDVSLTHAGSAHSIYVYSNKMGVSVTGCVINSNPTSSTYKSIGESTGCDKNLFANNVTNKGIKKVGENTVTANNIDTSATE